MSQNSETRETSEQVFMWISCFYALAVVRVCSTFCVFTVNHPINATKDQEEKWGCAMIRELRNEVVLSIE